MEIQEFVTQLNNWGKERVPFLFIIDFEMKNPQAFPLSEIDPRNLLYDINGITNFSHTQGIGTDKEVSEILHKIPLSLLEYRHKFELVRKHLCYGDSFLTNLTVDTEVQLSHNLHALFYQSKAKYKLWYDDCFLVFSPEIFVQIRDGRIYSYPMKGTIDADIPGADHIILKDKKELAEHVTIVDLIRNDLSRVSDNVLVSRFRYLERLKTSQKALLQVSSEIVGSLPYDFTSHLGEILVSLLPAGSVSGAPKPKTLEIIRQAEGRDRGYYTGVFGYFDGKMLDSGVMIRFIEHRDGKFYYKSGGGITTQSVAEAEYQEVIDKVYVPID